jgi:hypothetical protein
MMLVLSIRRVLGDRCTKRALCSIDGNSIQRCRGAVREGPCTRRSVADPSRLLCRRRSRGAYYRRVQRRELLQTERARWARRLRSSANGFNQKPRPSPKAGGVEHLGCAKDSEPACTRRGLAASDVRIGPFVFVCGSTPCWPWTNDRDDRSRTVLHSECRDRTADPSAAAAAAALQLDDLAPAVIDTPVARCGTGRNVCGDPSRTPRVVRAMSR